jgi:hypothetical protein
MNPVELLNTALTDRYTIEREIGRGGMATVYLARDLRHDRNVALKVLNPELGAVLGAERFFAEIRVTANLQHPNLLPLFDSGGAEGLLFYVMPFVDGESLRARLGREKQLPVDDAVRLAIAVAGALDYAHRHGVVHRDLKPENILLHEGQPLVADFGIALAVANAGGNRITQTGLSLGTPQYMSPEQATGDRTIDGRTDLYSLGAVLYEMLTGDPPHTASTSQAVIAKVLTDKPRSVRAGRPSVPIHVANAVDHALEKLPADRFATGQEMADALAGRGPSAMHVVPDSEAIPSSPRRRLVRALPWVVAAAALGVAGWTLSRPKPRPRPVTVVLEAPDSVAPRVRVNRGRMIAISRDGFQIVWVGGGVDLHGIAAAADTRLYLRTLADPVPRAIPGTDGATCPAFSPDGAWLLYHRGEGRVYKQPLAGGAPTPLIDSASGCPNWGDRGTILVERRGVVWRVPATGGPASIVASPDTARRERYVNPEILPGERYAIVTLLSSVRPRQLIRVNLENGRADSLLVGGLNGRFVPSGHLLYATTDGSLMVAPMSAGDARLTGPAELLVSNLQVQAGGSSQFAASDEGTLIAILGTTSTKRRLVAVDTAGVARPVTAEERMFGWVRISPDGNRAAFEIGESPAGPWDEWIVDLRSATLSRLTSGGSGLRTAGWTPDARKVIYLAPMDVRSTQNAVYARRAVIALPWDRSAPAETLFHGGDVQFAAVDPAHGRLALGLGQTATSAHIFLAPLDTPDKGRRITAGGSAFEAEPRLSPDGRWLAFTSDESGRGEVYVASTLPGGGRVQVSPNGGQGPVWDRTGTILFYRGPRRMMRATIAGTPELRVVKRDSLFEDRFFTGPYAYDVFPDGKRFLMVTSDAPVFQTMLLLNWPELLPGRRPH